MALETGATLGQYEVVRRLGAGGMGEVYLARDLQLRRQVALKVLPAGVLAGPEHVARFQKEARAASTLSNPHICSIHALGATTAGEHYIVMEFVTGETLRDRLGRGPLPIRDALDVATQMAAGVAAAHAEGVVHRDLKPENVMVRPDGLVKVLDFGVAKLMPGPNDTATDTQTAVHSEPGVAVGTAAYMSPEQARGDAVDARTDVWSMGVVLYELVTGRSPFLASSRSETLVSLLEHEPVPLARFSDEAPAELQRIVSKALRKDRSQRYQSVQDLKLDLEALRDARPDRAPVGRRPVLWLVAAGAAVLATLGAGTGWWLRARDRAVSAGTPTHGLVGKLARLTYAPGAQIEPTVSPDGRSLVYAADTAGNFDLWVQALDGGAPQQLTTHPAHEWQPDWSPDGKHLLFRSERDGGGIDLLSLADRHVRRVSPAGHLPDWSPDGRHYLALDTTMSVGSVQLFLGDVSGEAHPWGGSLTERQRGGAFGWSPEGRVLSICSGGDLFSLAGAPVEAATWDVEGGVSRPMEIARTVNERAKALGLRIVGGERLAVSASRIFFVGDAQRLQDIWQLDVDWERHAIVGGPWRLTTGAEVDGRPAAGLNGSVLFSSGTPDARTWLYELPADGPGPAAAGRPVTPATLDAMDPALSPDGSRLVLTTPRVGSEAQDLLEIRVSDGHVRTLRSVTAASFFMTRWAPDGGRVSYRLGENLGGGRWQTSIRVLDVESGVETQVTSGLPMSYDNPSGWSPDGRHLLAVSPRYRAGVRTLALVPVDGAPEAERRARVLDTDVVRGASNHTMSPDGRWILYSTFEGARSSLSMMAADGSEPQVITSGSWDDKPLFSPDGRWVYFLSSRGGSYNVWALGFDPIRGRPLGEPVRVTGLTYPLTQVEVSNLGISVVGRWLAVPFGNGTSSIWMVE